MVPTHRPPAPAGATGNQGCISDAQRLKHSPWLGPGSNEHNTRATRLRRGRPRPEAGEALDKRNTRSAIRFPFSNSCTLSPACPDLSGGCDGGAFSGLAARRPRPSGSAPPIRKPRSKHATPHLRSLVQPCAPKAPVPGQRHGSWATEGGPSPKGEARRLEMLGVSAYAGHMPGLVGTITHLCMLGFSGDLEAEGRRPEAESFSLCFRPAEYGGGGGDCGRLRCAGSEYAEGGFHGTLSRHGASWQGQHAKMLGYAILAGHLELGNEGD